MDYNEFLESLSHPDPNDLGKTVRSRKSLSAILSENLRRVILLCCVAALCVSLFYVGRSIVNYIKADSSYSELSLIMNSDIGIPAMSELSVSPATPCYEDCLKLTAEEIGQIGSTTKEVNPEFERMYAKLYSMKRKYPNLLGWIFIDGTSIDYPIMQADDNEYYLTRSYDDSRLLAGCIFADYRNYHSILNNKNFIVYGHHVTSKIMFHDLDEYLSREFFDEYNEIKIYTLGGMYTYNIVSVYPTYSTYNYIKTYFANGDEFSSWAASMIKNSIHKTDTVFGPDDHMITLSTCSNIKRYNRLCVEGILTSYYEK